MHKEILLKKALETLSKKQRSDRFTDQINYLKQLFNRRSFEHKTPKYNHRARK